MRMRTGRRARLADGLRATAAVAVLAAGTAACGDDGERPAPDSTENGGREEKTVALIEKTNEAMADTAFTASGTSSAFGGAEQTITWDPDHGFHMTVRSDDGTEADMYCRDGRSYISAPLLAETLSQRGQEITVGEELAGMYVTVQAQSCDAYFAVPTSAERAPQRDTHVGGTKSLAVTVRSGGGSDVYHLAAAGEPRLLKWDAELDGLQTRMTYGGYGEEYPVTLPPEDRRMGMSEFQAEVLGTAAGGTGGEGG